MHKQSFCLSLQQHLTLDCILNHDNKKTQNSSSIVNHTLESAMQALSKQTQTTWSTLITTKQRKTTTFVGTSKDREPPRTKAQLSTTDPFVHQRKKRCSSSKNLPLTFGAAFQTAKSPPKTIKQANSTKLVNADTGIYSQ